MGTDAKPERDAAHPLAVTKDDLAVLTPEQRQQIAQRKNANIVTAQLAGTNWGKGMDDATRRAVGDWGSRNGIDVTTEINVLGGNIYLNAQFYENRLVGLLHRGHILDYRRELISLDPRLEAIVKEPIDANLPADLKEIAEADRADAFREMRRRRRLRIEHGAPDNVAAVGLTTIVLAKLPNTPIRGVKWAPHGDNDPVGKAFPQETALTRSARRALKQCITHVPELARWVDGSEEDAAHTVAVAIREYQDMVARGERQVLAAGPETSGQHVAEDYGSAGARTPHPDDATKVRGPVAVVPAPAIQAGPIAGKDLAEFAGPGTVDSPFAPVPVAAPPAQTTEERANALELALGPDVDDDDMDLLSPDELAELAARRNTGR